MKQFFLIFLFLLLMVEVFAKNVTISGYIKDAGNGEGLIGATCYMPEIQNGAVTNQYGFYSITLPEGNHTINFSFIGYEAPIKNS